MTAKTLANRIEKYVQKWANELGISDYKFKFEFCSNKALKGNYAEVDTDDETREVTINVNRHRLNSEPHEVERTVVHELLHTRFNEYAELLEDIIKEYADSPKAKRILRSRAELIEHKIVVALADALTKEHKHGTI